MSRPAKNSRRSVVRPRGLHPEILSLSGVLRSMLKPRYFPLILIACAACSISVTAQTSALALKVAVLDFGETQTGLRAAEKLFLALSADKNLSLADREESRAAARGVGYAGSLNMTLEEARDL